ncbi:PD-(D/E)XK nuclease family protein [Acetivibrio cellulolyticus]|uniref:PD-(D/E)XK nuclease family protein n=1 Tax=Acetivibrio cellulolyticus TaxID=35830 RepID=UPI0001E2C210|nr:PD-(D/E)XK nuclease family protein [Acetivibrio cellulolyticus]
MSDLRFAEYFLFTQQSLATFDRCPLKFKKRYLENLKWDNFPDEEIKKRLEMGNDFHLLAYRYFLGVETGLSEKTEGFEELNSWMKSLESKFQKKETRKYLPEYKLRMAKGPLRLEANFDLLIVDGDKLEIWDWKTHGKENKPDRKGSKGNKYKKSLQSMVYLFVLKEQCEKITGKQVRAENISMFYWQPEPPEVLTDIRYSDEMHNTYREILQNKINGILEYDFSKFEKSLYEKNCKYCEFNWFCNNQRIDFNVIEEDEDFLDELEWESIEELT